MINRKCTSFTYRKKNNIFENLLNNSNKSEKENIKNEQQSLHEIIQKDKDMLFNIYSQKPFFKEILPHLKYQPDSELNHQNDTQNPNYFEKLMKNIEKTNKINIKKFKPYINHKSHNIEKIKRKKFKFDKNLLLKRPSYMKRNYSILLNKSHSTNESTKNIHKINISNIINNYSFDKSKKIKIKQSNSFVANAKEKRIEGFNNLLNLCKGEINHGNHVGKDFEKFNIKVSEDIKEIIQKDSKKEQNLKDQKMIGKEMMDNENDKYKIKEKEYFNDIKKKIDIKISEVYAYSNRKEYNKVIKDKESNKAYDIYLRDINIINQKIGEKKIIEKQSINKIKLLLDDVFIGKEYLKHRINEYKGKYGELKNINDNIEPYLNNDEIKINENNEYSIFAPSPNIKINTKKIILPKLVLKNNHQSYINN